MAKKPTTQAEKDAAGAKMRAAKGTKGVKKRGNVQKAQLSEAHKQVIDAYFANGCVSKRRALLDAGYSVNTATAMPHQVFGRPDVMEAIERRHRAHEKRAIVTEEKIIAELAKLAFANVGDLLEVNEDGSAYMDYNLMTAEHKAAIAEFQVEAYDEKSADGSVVVKKSRVKFSSKQAALDSLARIKGLYRDKIEVSHVGSLVERIQAARARMGKEKEAKE